MDGTNRTGRLDRQGFWSTVWNAEKNFTTILVPPGRISREVSEEIFGDRRCRQRRKTGFDDLRDR